MSRSAYVQGVPGSATAVYCGNPIVDPNAPGDEFGIVAASTRIFAKGKWTNGSLSAAEIERLSASRVCYGAWSVMPLHNRHLPDPAESCSA